MWAHIHLPRWMHATNVFNYYKGTMDAVSALTGAPVPGCFRLYRATITPNTFAWAISILLYSTIAFANHNSVLKDLVPLAPALPRCNLPGTQGRITLGNFPNDNKPILLDSTFRIMGSGNTDSYAIGDGPSISGSHMVASDILNSYPNCQGVWDFGLPINAVGDNTYFPICAGTVAAATTCANFIRQQKYPQGTVYTANLMFNLIQ